MTSKRVVDNACMLLETSFFGEVVDRLETQLLALTQEISREKNPAQAPSKNEMGWQQPQLSIFNVRRDPCMSVLGFDLSVLGVFELTALCVRFAVGARYI